FHRDVLDFRNCRLVEQPNGDFAQTMARQLLYSTWQHLLLQRLTASGDQFVAEFAQKAVKEVAYHRELAAEWTIRLGDGTEESARRMAEGLDWNWRFVPELFEVDDGLKAAIDAGIAPDPRKFEDEYRSAIAAVLAEAKLEAPADQHLTLRATIDGEEVRRNYSLCTRPADRDWMVTVKRIGGGLFSNWVGDRLKAGDTLDVMPPHGSFTSEFDAAKSRHLVGIAGGS